MSYELQNEFFPEFGKDDEHRKKKPNDKIFSTNIVVNFFSKQNIIIAIFCMLVLIITFAFGIEQGKKIVVNTIISDQVVEKPQNTTKTQDLPFQKQINENESKIELQEVIEKEPQKQINIDQLKDTKPYTIQIIAYKKENTALKKAEELRKRGEIVLVLKSSNWNKVCVGSFANKDEARGDLKRLEKQYKGCFLRRKQN